MVNTVGLGDLRGIFQPKWFYDSIQKIISTENKCMAFPRLSKALNCKYLFVSFLMPKLTCRPCICVEALRGYWEQSMQPDVILYQQGALGIAGSEEL